MLLLRRFIFRAFRWALYIALIVSAIIVFQQLVHYKEYNVTGTIVMNLYTPADGLFATHVTWNDIEEDMQRELGTVALFGPNKTAKNIGDGNGFMSRIVLIDPDWQHKDKQLPDKFIVKIVTQLAVQQLYAVVSEENKTDNPFDGPEFKAALEFHQKRLHNAEVTVYNHLLKLPEGKIPLAKVYYMKKFSESNPVKGYIIMEYLDDIKPIHIYQNITPDNVKQILRAKAVMEATSLRFTPDERKEFTEKPFSELFAEFFKKEAIDNMMKMFREFQDGKLVEQVAQMEKITPDLVDLAWADQLADEMGMQRVLCHGDLWSMNILWRQKGDDVTMAALIDFQTAHMGCPANDLVRIFSACLSGKDRRNCWEELTEEFYSYLKEEVCGTKMPYTLEQLKESCRRFFPLGAFIIIPMIGPLFDLLCKNPDEEQRQRVRKDLQCYHEKRYCNLFSIWMP
ncbi:hypothetical protein Y032_0306g1996 [Ancylostoma ceylanicum]|uniref:CHK kinase-like domain-containing protein n=2 Tax=Ancylostoma ceylanicum TaxID=53326 RepID=A0A016S3G0_9BILA|nr:hypothetical protein Y032_0306g1996 [Ancylostoma ceylanicum]